MEKLPGKIAPDVINKFQQADFTKQTKPSLCVKPIVVGVEHVSQRNNFNKYNQPSTKSQIFGEPIPLIFTNENGVLECNKNAIKELCQIENALNVVAVVGTLRTGKSYLLNKLANIKSGSGFAMGHTIEPVTKGIWVMCCPHPVQEDQILVLLDTEGVCDPRKTEHAEDKWLYVLATLLCSTLIYNNKGAFDQTAFDQLKFLKVIESSVKLGHGIDADFLLDFYFPKFILALRDFNLKLVDTPNAYLEELLKLEEGQTNNIEIFNDERKLIRRYFPRRTCFAFSTPTFSCKLDKLMDLPDNEHDSTFLETLSEFRDHIYLLEPKQMKSGRTINGRMFATLVQSYVNAIKDTQCPCIIEALQRMIDQENEYVIKHAADLYREEMKKRLSNYVPSDAGLVKYHQECMNIALNLLGKTTVYNDIDICKERVMELFKQHLKEFKKLIDQDSEYRCLNKLGYLNKTIEKKLKNGDYKVSSGYDDYWNDVNHIITEYNRESRSLGSQARNVLQEFIDGKEKEEQYVFKIVSQLQFQSATAPKLHHLVSAKSQLSNCQATEEDITSEDVDKEVQKIQSKSRQNIYGQYTDLKKMKLHELEKVKKELSPNDPYYQKLYKESRTLVKIEEQYPVCAPPPKDLKGGRKLGFYDCTLC